MAIEDMIDRIMEEARMESRKILSEAGSETARIKNASRKEVDDEIAGMERNLEKEIRQTRNIYISDGKRKARQAILSSKEELIWDALSAIRGRIKKLSQDELAAYLHPMLSRTLESLGNDAVVYAVGSKDEEVLSKKVHVEGVLEGSTIDSEPLSRFKGADLLGGFIAIARNGSMLADMTFHGLMERNEDRIRETIAEDLFENM
ncbi:MAG: V-type ATP synthase subunit E [Candidatus Thermoplasmatota archaeon]|nr:V-type ATP synthase subunit E [Candidatus Thermoplasmatota archaeon]